MKVNEVDVRAHRPTEHEVDDLIVGRWSPRAMSGESLDASRIGSLFEAARWAPSAFNAQPWRFLHATRESSDWGTFLGLLGEFNQVWCKQAALLIVVLSKRTFEHNGKPAATHSFDAGAAWQNLALQATRLGLVSHGMAGFDYDAARERLGVPDDFAVEAMIAVGLPGDPETLPESLREREQPSDRKAVAEIAFAGAFPAG